MLQTQAEVSAELKKWYEARANLAGGKAVTISTATGTRSLTQQDGAFVEQMITKLERKLNTPAGQTHNFAVADLSNR